MLSVDRGSNLRSRLRGGRVTRCTKARWTRVVVASHREGGTRVVMHSLPSVSKLESGNVLATV